MATKLQGAVRGATASSVDVAELWERFKRISDSGSRDFSELDADINKLLPEEKKAFQAAASDYDLAQTYREGTSREGWKSNAEKKIAPVLRSRDATNTRIQSGRIDRAVDDIEGISNTAADRLEGVYGRMPDYQPLLGSAWLNANMTEQEAQADRTAATNRLNAGYRDAAARQAALSGQYNTESRQRLSDFNAAYDTADAADRAALDTYNANVAPLRQRLEAGGYTPIGNDAMGLGLQQQSYDRMNSIYGGALDVAPDAYGLGLQNQALANFNDIYNGGLNIQGDPYGSYLQDEAYRTYGRWASGELDQTSQAAQAYADPNAVRAQWDSYNDLRGAAQGNLNTVSQASNVYAPDEIVQDQARAMDRLEGVVDGSMDVESQAAQARADQGSIDAQNDVMARYKAGSDPTVTAQERMIMETFRRQAEQQLRSRQDAVMGDLSARGMGGSGAELANMLGSQQLVGEQGVLAELGAQANAVGRAERMLKGYGDTAANIRQQSFGEEFARGAAADETAHMNANRSVQALGLYIDNAGKIRAQAFDEAYARAAAGDEVAMRNADRMLQASGLAGQLATEIRNSSFDEAYRRGDAADRMAIANVQNRMRAGELQGNMATDIRTANDNIAMANQRTQYLGADSYGRQATDIRNSNDALAMANQTTRMQGAQGMSTDAYRIRELNEATSQFNKTQEMMQQRQREDYAQKESERLSLLESGILGDTRSINKGISDRALERKTEGDTSGDTMYGRDQDAIAGGLAATDVDYNSSMDLADALAKAGSNMFGNTRDLLSSTGDFADTYAGGITGIASLRGEGPRMRGMVATEDLARKRLNSTYGA